MIYLKIGLIAFNLTMILGVLSRSNYQINYLILLLGLLCLVPGIYGYLKFETNKYFLYSLVGLTLYLIAIYLGLKL
jgi:hypothetical membrane protein